jgi:hypothetical protein
MITNFVNVHVISSITLNKSTEEKKQQTLLRFMMAYSVINLIYSIINLLSIMSKCVAENSIFCSNLYQTEFAQYFKIICVEYLGSALKTMSNLVYFAISLNRYILFENETAIAKYVRGTFTEWSRRKRTIWVVVVFFLIGGLNVHHILIHKVLGDALIDNLISMKMRFFLTFPFVLANSHSYSYAYESEASVEQKATVYLVLFILNFILNDFILFFAFTIIDVLLIKSLQRALRTKKKTFHTQKGSNKKAGEQINEIQQTEKNALKVISTNTLIIVAAKIFDLTMAVSKFLIWRQPLWLDILTQLPPFCYTVKICGSYEELVKVFYLATYGYSTWLFFYLNKPFRQNFFFGSNKK